MNPYYLESKDKAASSSQVVATIAAANSDDVLLARWRMEEDTTCNITGTTHVKLDAVAMGIYPGFLYHMINEILLLKIARDQKLLGLTNYLKSYLNSLQWWD